MRLGVVSVAYHEPRFIKPQLEHIKLPVEHLVLNSLKPWHGDPLNIEDKTAQIATAAGATVLAYAWPNEHEQRNAGQEWFCDKDWILVLDPDEFLTEDDQVKLKEFLENVPTEISAVVVGDQFTYWKRHYRISPTEAYKQIIAVRPSVRFVDKRVVNTGYISAPVTLHHMSWARTDEEIWNKITHYGHAHEFDNRKWFESVWKKWEPEMENLHPLTPEALKRAVPAELPPELEKLGLWPSD